MAARTPTGDLFLLTPGPLTTSRATKEAMVHDWGSRDTNFIALNRRVRDTVVRLVHAEDTHVAVLMQGSGTFAVEATVGTLVPRNGAPPTPPPVARLTPPPADARRARAQ